MSDGEMDLAGHMFEEYRARLRLKSAMFQALEGLTLAVLNTPSGEARNLLTEAHIKAKRADELIRADQEKRS